MKTIKKEEEGGREGRSFLEVWEWESEGRRDGEGESDRSEEGRDGGRKRKVRENEGHENLCGQCVCLCVCVCVCVFYDGKMVLIIIIIIIIIVIIITPAFIPPFLALNILNPSLSEQKVTCIANLTLQFFTETLPLSPHRVAIR